MSPSRPLTCRSEASRHGAFSPSSMLVRSDDSLPRLLESGPLHNAREACRPRSLRVGSPPLSPRMPGHKSSSSFTSPTTRTRQSDVGKVQPHSPRKVLGDRCALHVPSSPTASSTPFSSPSSLRLAQPAAQRSDAEARNPDPRNPAVRRSLRQSDSSLLRVLTESRSCERVQAQSPPSSGKRMGSPPALSKATAAVPHSPRSPRSPRTPCTTRPKSAAASSPSAASDRVSPKPLLAHSSAWRR